MIKISEDVTGDLDAPDLSAELHATEAGREGMNRIARYSDGTRDAMRSTFLKRATKGYGFGINRFSRSYLDAKQYRNEAMDQLHDKPRNEQYAFEKENAIADSARLTVSEAELIKQRKQIHVIPQKKIVISNVKGVDGAGADIDMAVEIDHTNRYLKQILQEEEMRKFAGEMKSKRPLWAKATIIPWLLMVLSRRGLSLSWLQSRGVTITGAGFDHFSPAQADAFAKKYHEAVQPYESLGQLFAADGTSELNVQTAMALAQRYPEDVVQAVSSDAADARNEVDKARKNMQLGQAVQDLSQIAKETQSHSLEETEREINDIKHDIPTIRTTYAPTSIYGIDIRDHGGYDFTDPDDQREVRRKLQEQLKKMEDAKKYYSKIRAAIERIHTMASDTAALAPYITGGAVDPAAIDKEIDPKILSDKLTVELKVKTKEVYLKDIEDKEKVVKDIEEGKSVPTSREAIIAAYEVYFQKKQLAPAEAHRAAVRLYAQNSLTKEQWDNAQHVLNDQNVSGKELQWMEWPGEKVHELINGSEQSFICHIAESPAIGLQREYAARQYGPFKIFDATRRLGFMWRKMGARPGWGAMDYAQLMTAYYALRNAAKNGDIPNSGYFRTNRDAIVRMLLRKHLSRLIKESDENGDEEEKKEEDAMHQQQMIARNIQIFLAGDVPPHYKASVDSAIDFAKQETGWRRKALLGRSKKIAGGTLNYGVKKPTVMAAKTVAYPFRKAGGLAKSFWKWGTSVSGQSPSGSGGAPH